MNGIFSYLSWALLSGFLFYATRWASRNERYQQLDQMGTAMNRWRSSFAEWGGFLYLHFLPFLRGDAYHRRFLAAQKLQDAYIASPWLIRKEWETMIDIGMILWMLPIAFMIRPGLSILVVSLAALRWVSLSYELNRMAARQEQEILEDLPAMLTRFILALHAGTLPVQVWHEVAQTGDRPLYQEMKRIEKQWEVGESLLQAASHFGTRFGIDSLRDCSRLFAESLNVGGMELADGMERIRRGLLQKRRNAYTVEAERAQQKLLLPGLLSFIGILLLVIVPLFGHGIQIGSVLR